MRTNWKIIQSILTLSILIIAAFSFTEISETQACSQNTISTGCGWCTDSVWLVVDGQAAYYNYVPTATVPGVEVYNVIPTPRGVNGIAPDVKIKTFTIQNKGLSKGSLYVQFVPVKQTLGEGSNVVIKLGNIELYNNGVNKASKYVYLMDIDPASKRSSGTVSTDLVYNFADNGRNQNRFENKELKFNLVFTMGSCQVSI